MNVAAIVPAAGLGKRLGSGLPKALVKISGKPLIVHTLERLSRAYLFREIIVAAPASHAETFRKTFSRYRLSRVQVIIGGASRAESVRNAVRSAQDACDWVLIHDAARPFITGTVVRRLMKQAKITGAAAIGISVTSTLKRLDARRRCIVGTEDRNSLVLIQTPQVFNKRLLMRRYEKLGVNALSVTDEAALFENSNIKTAFVPGDLRNLKITTPEDIDLYQFYSKRG